MQNPSPSPGNTGVSHSIWLLAYFSYIHCVCLCACVRVHTFHSTSVGARGQLEGVGSLDTV